MQQMLTLILLGLLAWASPAWANDFAQHPQYAAFKQKALMQGLQGERLDYWMAHCTHNDNVLKLFNKPGESAEWHQYKQNFLTPTRYSKGRAFADKNQAALQLAEQAYHIPTAILLGILGVETAFGANMGEFNVASALANLAFRGARRNDFFSNELLTLIILSEQGKLNARTLKGSFAGAFGYGQFMPSSYAKYAVDFNNDGKVDLNNATDAIGSIANYMQANGWQAGQPIAIEAQFVGTDPEQIICNSIDQPTTAISLYQQGLQPKYDAIYAEDPVCGIRLFDKNGPIYFFTYPNFRVITLYNRSRMYATAVWQLGANVVKQAN